MKNLLLILFLGLSSAFYAQQDTLKIPADELEEFFLALDTLETQDSAKAVLIQELEFEIKSRQKTAKKIADEVAKNTEIKSKITSKIKKQSQSKPSLKETLTTSHKDAEKLSKELEKRLKSEGVAKRSLDKALAKLKDGTV